MSEELGELMLGMEGGDFLAVAVQREQGPSLLRRRIGPLVMLGQTPI